MAAMFGWKLKKSGAPPFIFHCLFDIQENKKCLHIYDGGIFVI
jgi:hypothetical protein